MFTPTSRIFKQAFRFTHANIYSIEKFSTIRNFHARSSFQLEESKDSRNKETIVSDVVGGVAKVNLPPLKRIQRSNGHRELLENAQKKMKLEEERIRFINDFIVPLREMYFNNASQFLNSPKSPGKRAKGVIPNYTSYFPAEAIKYDKTGMALSEIHVHQKFNAWWMRTTGRGPNREGDKKKKKK